MHSRTKAASERPEAGTPRPSLLHTRRRVPSADVADRYANAVLPADALSLSSMLTGGQLEQTELGNLRNMLLTPFPMSR